MLSFKSKDCNVVLTPSKEENLNILHLLMVSSTKMVKFMLNNGLKVFLDHC